MVSRPTKAQQSKWDEVIETFRALGGTADNVMPGYGARGRGLFPIDPDKPVRIALPENLLVDVEAVMFEDGKFRIRPEARVPDRERAFFEFFENELSWGDGGKAECEAYLDQLDRLPESVHDFLSEELGFQFPDASRTQDEQIQNRFIRGRAIAYEGRDRLMPVLHLVNHTADGCPFKFEKGISIDRTFENEVCAHYGLYDPWGVFENWGFSCAEPLAFSMPSIVNVDGQELAISRQLDRRTKRGKFRVPIVEKDGKRTSISYVMLGHARFPRASKGIFYQLMRDIGQPNAEALFDEIRRFNIQKFLNFLAILDDHRGPLITTLKQTCRHQISALTHAIGTRKIDG
ncbi:MAG: hypothetical protein QNJ62_07405 [Methyloceanibacter sp.]|nr:hypothetical protein [Methyloceanibacter sp.]